MAASAVRSCASLACLLVEAAPGELCCVHNNLLRLLLLLVVGAVAGCWLQLQRLEGLDELGWYLQVGGGGCWLGLCVFIVRRLQCMYPACD